MFVQSYKQKNETANAEAYFLRRLKNGGLEWFEKNIFRY